MEMKPGAIEKVSRLKSLLFLIFIFFLVEAVARAGVVSRLYFPPVSKDLLTFYNLTISGVLPSEVLISFGRMFAGYFLAIGLMVPLGILIGLFPFFYYMLEPLIELFRPLGAPAIIPVVMLFLGIGDSMKIFVVFYACAFPILINTMDGVRSVDPVLVNTARTFGFNKFETVRKVILPGALPQIFSGFRISLPLSLIVVITAELIGGNNGIGHYILNMQRNFNVRETYAGVIMIAIIGYCLHRLFLYIDSKLIGWHKSWAGKV